MRRTRCREVRSMFFMAPLIALGAGIFGYILANHYDYPPAQSTVALLGMLVAVSWVVRKFTLS